MMQSVAYFAILLISCSFAAVKAQNPNITTIIDKPDTPIYVNNGVGASSKWRYNFSGSLRGFVIYNNLYPKLAENETLSIYRGNDTIMEKYLLAKYTTDNITSVEGFQNQWLALYQGEPLTIIYVSPSTPVARTEWMFLVSSIDANAILQPPREDSGVFYQEIINATRVPINTYSNVTQHYHFIPKLNTFRLAFLLETYTALTNNMATLTLYRGNANSTNDTTTIIKTYQNINNVDSTLHGLDYGETLSLEFVYHFKNVNDPKVGFSFLISPFISNTSDIVTLSPSNLSTSVNSTNPGDTTTMTQGPTTTTTSSSPFLFTIAPVIVTMIFQLCQNTLSIAQ